MHEAAVSLFLQPVKIPLDGSTTRLLLVAWQIFQQIIFLTWDFLQVLFPAARSQFLPEGKLNVEKGALETKILRGPIHPLTPCNICAVTQYIKCSTK